VSDRKKQFIAQERNLLRENENKAPFGGYIFYLQKCLFFIFFYAYYLLILKYEIVKYAKRSETRKYIFHVKCNNAKM